ncbi:Hsp70 nucleotide exchange factor FES1 [Psilocybe cubensis]|nr:Hsp70 nucleotide exchange factor FES1 [Psilocybe cubensis]KAH9476827.1 Hsp70 nucleotide exchange factor FES1 [Psilocybe cubensis]
MDSAASDHPPAERKDLDPAIIDMILGKPDSVQMKEDMAIAVDDAKSEDERINALDHMEMLIEHIDNANDLEKLKLWEPLQSLLTSNSSTSEIRTQALWVIGTALQNNPSAQEDYMLYNPLPILLSFLDPSPSSSPGIRAKAIYALSGLLKHNSPAVQALGPSGWTKLRESLQDPSITVRRKVVFLLSSLLLPNGSGPTPTPAPTAANILTPDHRPAPTSDEPIFSNSHASNLRNPNRSNTSSPTVSALSEYNIMESIISGVVTPVPYGNDGESVEPDADFEEKAVHLLFTYAVSCSGELSQSQKEALKSWIQTQKTKKGESQLLESWNISREEYAGLVGKLL